MAKKKSSEAARLMAKLRAESMTPEQRSEAARKAGRARLERISPSRRREIAKKAAQARWAKRKGGKATAAKRKRRKP